MAIVKDTYIDYLNVEKNEIKNLPSGISISTMCATCKLNTKLDITNIQKYLKLDKDSILTVKMNNDDIRTLVPKKKEKKRIKVVDPTVKVKDTSKNHFYNQITVVVRTNEDTKENTVKDLNDAPKINMKLFKNGSVQMSGCKSLKNINIALNKLIIKLKEVKAKFEDGRIVEKRYIEDHESITVRDFKINMINSNYEVNMQIDREKLYNLLTKKKIKSSYEPCIRACVIIKYAPIEENIENKEVSVFVFQKGNIIITGARNRSHIISAYDYMNKILLDHTDEIIKKNEKNEESIIMNIYKDIMKEVDIGLIKI
jgi:TATA-box binding protein (TBP) (component of TFIID and TFIIIB)